jgi:transposase
MNGAQVVDFLETLAEPTTPELPTVVVLDNASFHTCAQVRARWGDWARRGLWLVYQPAYRPHWNLMERVWLELKHRLLPRRWYRDAASLRASVERVLQDLGGVEI